MGSAVGTYERGRVRRPALAASRAIDLLNFMAAEPAQGYSLTELVRHLDLNPASCHALLDALTRDGYLDRHPRRRTYRLGPALVAIGSGALECHPAVAEARTQAAALAAALGLECLLTGRVGDMLIALSRAGRASPPVAVLRVGQRIPMIPPIGTPFLAWADAATVAVWAARGTGDHARDVAALAAVRRRGYAVTLLGPAQARLGEAVSNLADAPFAEDLQAGVPALIDALGNAYLLPDADADEAVHVGLISVPIFNSEGAVAYTLSLLGFPGPLRPAEIESLARRLMQACAIVMQKTNGCPPDQGRATISRRA